MNTVSSDKAAVPLSQDIVVFVKFSLLHFVVSAFIRSYVCICVVSQFIKTACFYVNRNYSAILATLQITSYALGV